MRGIDLVGLFVGSEGCFGIATEIEVRLLLAVENIRTLLGIFDTMEAAGHAVTDIIGSGLMPAAVEIVDNATIVAVEASVFAAGYPVDAGAALVVEFDGTEAGLDDDADRAGAVLFISGRDESDQGNIGRRAHCSLERVGRKRSKLWGESRRTS